MGINKTIVPQTMNQETLIWLDQNIPSFLGMLRYEIIDQEDYFKKLSGSSRFSDTFCDGNPFKPYAVKFWSRKDAMRFKLVHG